MYFNLIYLILAFRSLNHHQNQDSILIYVKRLLKIKDQKEQKHL